MMWTCSGIPRNLQDPENYSVEDDGAKETSKLVPLELLDHMWNLFRIWELVFLTTFS